MSDGALTAALGKRKAKTRRGRKFLEAREPKIFEEAKTALIIRGNKSSIEVGNLLRDLHKIRNPLSTLFMNKHQDHPFEDMGRLEHLCKKYDHSLFAFGSSSKKRPFRLIFGRLFDNRLLDMQEFGVEGFKPTSSFGPTKSDSLTGGKPLVIFQGSAFETDERVKRSKSLLLDFFSGPNPSKVLLEGLEHVVVCSAFDKSAGSASKPDDIEAEAEETLPSVTDAPPISVTRYRVNMRKSGSKLPRIELEEVGPRFRLALDRTRDPDREMWKQSIKVPKAAKEGKKKNIKTDSMGKKRGKIHLGKQDFNQIHTVHHSKAKKRKLDAELSSRKKGKTATKTEG